MSNFVPKTWGEAGIESDRTGKSIAKIQFEDRITHTEPARRVNAVNLAEAEIERIERARAAAYEKREAALQTQEQGEQLKAESESIAAEIERVEYLLNHQKEIRTTSEAAIDGMACSKEQPMAKIQAFVMNIVAADYLVNFLPKIIAEKKKHLSDKRAEIEAFEKTHNVKL